MSIFPKSNITFDRISINPILARCQLRVRQMDFCVPFLATESIDNDSEKFANRFYT